MRIILENFMYTFGGKSYLQKLGGPIGARVTMAAARLVIQDWSEQYRMILIKAKLEIYLFQGYVDDGCQGSSKIRRGMKFIESEMEFRYEEEWDREDMEK